MTHLRRHSRPANDCFASVQLSLCPNSLVGIPPLSLALSCSAGITAAAASVGVHLLQLEQPPPATTLSRRRSSHLSSVLLTLPASSCQVVSRMRFRQFFGRGYISRSMSSRGGGPSYVEA